MNLSKQFIETEIWAFYFVCYFLEAKPILGLKEEMETKFTLKTYTHSNKLNYLQTIWIQ